MRLQIDVVPFNIPAVSIPYQQFHVGDAASEYLLTVTSDTSGGGYNLYNSLSYNTDCKFSTYDRDNDSNNAESCATIVKGGWWFSGCCKVCLNGVYGGASQIANINMRMHYLSDNNQEPIKTVTLKITAIN